MNLRLTLAVAGAIAWAACADDAAREAAAPAPARAAPGSAAPAEPRGLELPDLAWDGVDADGHATSLRLSALTVGDRPLVVRVNGGAWCGTCRWHAAHTGALVAEGVSLLDLVVGDRDNSPATPAALAEWRGLTDVPVATAADPTNALRAIAPGGGAPSPLFVLLEPRSRRVRDVLSNPGPDELLARVRALTGAAPAPPTPLVDGLLHPNEWDMLRAMRAPGAPPPDPTSAVADSDRAAALGQALFQDVRLSARGDLSCASCHDPKAGLAMPDPAPAAATKATRKAPSIALAAHFRYQLWDGSADSLWAQALGPIENPDELGATRRDVARLVVDAYAEPYAAAFGAAPSAAEADVTRTFVDVGKAIAAYERRFRVAPNRLDAYASGDFGALTETEKLGLVTFFRTGCPQCHWGPLLSDGAFHVTRMPGRKAEEGRARGAALLAASEFRSSGPYSDAPGPPIAPVGAIGAWRTPSLRGVAAARSFGHGGALGSLVAVTELYGRGGGGEDEARASGTLEPWLMTFGEGSRWALPPFLKVLTADVIVP